MEKTVFISLPIEDLQSVIIDCVNACLRNNKQENKPPTEQPETDQFLTAQEAAEFLNLSVPTLYTKVHKAEIPFYKRTKRLYFSKQELTEWIKAGRKKTNAETEKQK